MRFFELAEEELYCSLGQSWPDVYYSLGVGFPRVELWCRYRKPARWGDVIEITTWINERTDKSMLYQFEMRRDGEPELVAEASYRVVCVKRPEFRAVPLPPLLLDVLRDYLPPLTPRADASQ